MNIGYKLVKNCMAATAEKAPYLGMAIPVGSLAYDNILKKMIKAGTKMTQPTAKYFLDALYEFAAERIAAEQVRINVGTVSIYPMIDGSFDSEDAPFDPKRNSLYVGATLSQELRDRVAGIAPDFTGDTSVGTVKLHSCMDLETQVFKAIRGAESFRLAGANLTVPDGADESLGLYAKNGVEKVADIEVSETDGGQQITCAIRKAVREVPKGVYKVRLASHGLDPTDPLTVATLTVTLTEAVLAVSPTIRCFSTRPTGDEDHAYDAATRSYVRGEHLALGTDDTVTVERMRQGRTEWSPAEGVTVNAGESSDARIVLDYADTVAGMDDKLRVKVSIGGKTAVSNEVTVTDEE